MLIAAMVSFFAISAEWISLYESVWRQVVTAVATAMAGKGFGWQHQRGHNSRGKSDLTKHFLYPLCSRIAEKCYPGAGRASPSLTCAQ
jgi:hypothetical protein